MNRPNTQILPPPPVAWVIPLVLFCTATCFGQNINDLPNDLTVPPVEDSQPGPGKRFRITLPEYNGWRIQHVVYLPTDWKPDRQFPVIVEYPGNGGYKNELGDVCTGRVEDCKLGYGASGGIGFIWVCLPLVDPDSKSHAVKWWGDPDETTAYCRSAVQHVCQTWGGDPNRMILSGFSRGAIACGYIGLRDDDIAKLWRAMIIHSHYDGVRRWGYPDDDPKSAKQRLNRFQHRPQFITHETSVDAVRQFLVGSQVEATLVPIPYPNHTDTWVLKDLPERSRLRTWLMKVVE